ncbi:MAG TPA: response regulator transcription factor [Solirubrobacteraceae bacterium]|nr:response regulator transcription factor [Solirubrobacteraceae bacterium]
MTPRSETAEAGPLRVLVAEDDVLLREGIAGLLTEAGCEVVAQAGDAEDLVRKGLAHRPEVVVADVRMPPRREDDGLAAAIELRRQLPEVGVLVLSQYYEETLAMELITEHAEGVGYLLKDRVADVASFIDAVRRVAAGGSALDPEIVALLLRHRGRSGQLDELTPRERDVLAGMAEGKSNQGIAEDLVLSQKAIEKHVTAIMHKLGIGPSQTGNRRVLAVLAYLRAGQQ